MTSIREHLGVHAEALALRERRNGILASNIAHAATPGYKARDINFDQALAVHTGGGALRTTAGRHFATGNGPESGVAYRAPINPSLDGNTVELDVEQREFAENTLRYQLSLTMLNRKISGLSRAIRGE